MTAIACSGPPAWPGEVAKRPCTATVGTPSSLYAAASFFARVTLLATENELNTPVNLVASTPFFAISAAMSAGFSRKLRSPWMAVNTLRCIVSIKPIVSSV